MPVILSEPPFGLRNFMRGSGHLYVFGPKVFDYKVIERNPPENGAWGAI